MRDGSPHIPHLVVSAATVTVTALGFIGFALLLWTTSDFLLLLFVGALFAILMNGIATALAPALGNRYGMALALGLLLLLGATSFLFWALAPNIGTQVAELQRRIPEAFERLTAYFNRLEWVQQLLQAAPAKSQLMDSRANVFERITGVLSTTLSALTSAVFVLFFGLFLAASPQKYQAGFLHLLPHSRRARAAQILTSVADTLWWWLLAQFASMLVVGLLTWAGLWALNIPLALTLALIASLLTFVPNIGPILSAIPAVLLALLQSPSAAMWVAVLYMGIQTVESYLITPVFQQRAISLPPALLIAAQVLMGVLAGPIGLLVATPLTAVVVVLVKELYVKGVLHDPLEE